MRSIKLVLLASVAALAVGVPAQAADVTVNFGLSAGTYLPTGALCPVSVPAGSDGVAVLDAAVDAGCIVSYQTESFGFGDFVSCINEICGLFQETPAASVGTYWGFYVDGEAALYGVNDYVSANGSEVVFTYEPFAY